MFQKFRRDALKGLTNKIGVYALCDLDGTPIYIGLSEDGVRSRVYRHLTSARSDVLANRLIDVWEIAFVKAWIVEHPSDLKQLEAVLFTVFNRQKSLMNGSTPILTGPLPNPIPEPSQTIQVLSDEDIRVRREPALRLPRQIEQIGRLVDQILNVKNSVKLRSSLAAHFDRLDAYRAAFLREGPPKPRTEIDEDAEDSSD